MDHEELEHDLPVEQTPGLHRNLFGKRRSNPGKYEEMVVGDRGLPALLRYELITLLISQIPGALGLILRKSLYRPLFKSVGKNVIFGRNLSLRQPHKISLGDNIIIDDDCLLDAKGIDNQGIIMGDYVTLGRLSSLVCKDADIIIGSRVNIGSTVKIIAANKGRITIGNGIDIGSSSHFSGGSYDYSRPEVLPSTQRLPTRGITVEDLAWIGAGVIVLDGVTIGEKSIIGAGAVVNKDIPSYSVAVGVPADVIRKRN